MSKIINTVVIAAAGRGTRMRELSANKPKHLVEVCGKPFLHFVLESVKQAGFERVLLVVGYKVEKMTEFIEQSGHSVELIVQQDYVGDRYGTAAVVEVVEHALPNTPFVSFNGDGLFTPQILQQAMHNDGYNHLFAQPTPNANPASIVHIGDNDMMVGIGGQTVSEEEPLVNSALYTFQPEIFNAVRAVELSPRGEYEVTDAINMLCEQNRMKAHRIQDQWVELGKPEDIPTVEKFIKTYFHV